MADFVACGSRLILLLVIASSIEFGALGLHSFGFSGSTPPAKRTNNPVYMTAMGVGMAFFGFLGLVSLLRLFRPPEYLSVGTQGVRWTGWSDKHIPWSEIACVTVRDVQYARYFVLHLRDRTAFPPHGLQRVLGPINRSTLGGDVWINMNALGRRYDEALPAFKAFSLTAVVF